VCEGNGHGIDSGHHVAESLNSEKVEAARPRVSLGQPGGAMTEDKQRSRVVVVTGASGGIGRASAEAFGRRGDRVALLARGESGLNAAAEAIRDSGGIALTIPTDIADCDQVLAAADRVEEELGPIDVWVNVAFTSVFAPFDQIRPDEFRRVTEVAYLGYVYGTMAALQRMKPRDSGTIVHVGSALAYRGIPLQSAYCGAKHAIQGFHESLRCELLHERSGVHVTMVQMPAVNTPQFSWGVVPVAAQRAAGAADLPTRNRRRSSAPRRRSPPSSGVLGGRQHHGYACRQRHSAQPARPQQTGQPRDPDQPANLWHPADGRKGHDFGAHGMFDSRSAQRSPQWWASQHHGLLAALVGMLAVAATGWWGLSRRGRGG
jgi:NAD(P)-dependent dehydrogenase (short-subunit alcohol dehydrogenase family)